MSITHEEAWLKNAATCVGCGRKFNPYWDYIDNDEFTCDEPYKVSRCSDCFEADLEQYEIDRRERIARENEY